MIILVVVTMMVMMMKKIVMRLVRYGGWMDGWTFHQGLLPRMYEASLGMCEAGNSSLKLLKLRPIGVGLASKYLSLASKSVIPTSNTSHCCH